MRKALWLCCAIGIGALAFSGCGGQGVTPKATTVFLDPEYASKSITTVALLPFANASGEADAEKIMGAAIEGQFVYRKDYEFMTANRVARKAQAAGMSADLESLRRQWVHQRQFKNDLARKLANELKIDAFMVGEITKWEEIDLRAEETGYPTSAVSARVFLMEARTGAKLWEATADKVVKGQYWDPSEQSVTGYVDEAGISRGSGGTPVQVVEAPSIREVAEEAATNIMMALPEGPKEVPPETQQSEFED
jgi:hypothetical protein